MSLPYPPVSYHSFICPQGMAALPKTTTHACSRRAFFYSSQHPLRKSDVPNCSPTAVVLSMVAFEIFFSPTFILKCISTTTVIVYIKNFKSRFCIKKTLETLYGQFQNLAKIQTRTLNMLQKCFRNCRKLM